MNIQKSFTTLFAALMLILAPAARAEQARVYLDFTAAELRKVPMAVPYFQDKAQPAKASAAGRAMADLMSRGLAFHGFIDVIPPDRYQGRQNSDWQTLGADFTLFGQYEIDRGNMVLELRLMGIGEGRMLLGRRYRGPADSQQEMILKFCDEVILTLTGETGISRSRIAFTSDKTGAKEIYLADVLGDNVRQVTNHRDLAVAPRFSPDGKFLTYTSYHHGNADLYITNLAQSKTTKPLSRRKGLNMAPAWAPDGKSMVVTLSKDGNPDLYEIDTKGFILRQLTAKAGINVSPSWSPDGKHITFVSDRSGTPQIYIMNMATKAVHRLTYEGKYNTSPSWSPKGNLIAYAADYGGHYQLCLISPEGGSPVRLTKGWGDHESPSWSPDGNQIVFARNRGNHRKICTIFRNGKGLRELFDLKGDQNFPQWSPRLEQM
ncbi:MAG: Tol-Pal system beta propeller repeat protein TolB [Desulfobulbaceae bacterium]|nr:Tol-Pal system beta propeller repeat protein TolB [Desulfobulbaceae bacterium]